jgi:polyhydroxyalkanoate synthesis regulator phasin
MNTTTKRGFVAGTVIALVVGLGAAAAIAANDVFSPSEESKAVIDDAAAQLGVEPGELSGALKQAMKNRIDAAAEAGRLTEDQATELKARIDSDDFPLIGPGMHGPGFHGHGPGHPGRGEVLSAAASYLGLTETELREQLADQTLAEVAKEQGKSVSGLVQAMVTAAEKQIDQAVADGKLTKDQAAAIKADLEARFESMANGEHPGGEFGHHPGRGDGSWAPRGPPMFDDDPGA